MICCSLISLQSLRPWANVPTLFNHLIHFSLLAYCSGETENILSTFVFVCLSLGSWIFFQFFTSNMIAKFFFPDKLSSFHFSLYQKQPRKLKPEIRSLSNAAIDVLNYYVTKRVLEISSNHLWLQREFLILSVASIMNCVNYRNHIKHRLSFLISRWFPETNSF